MVKRLLLKSNEQMIEKDSLIITKNGITDNINCHKFRQVLIVPTSTLNEFNLEIGQLKENILIDTPFDIHSLESGTVLQIGNVKIRLTFHCEPCVKIKNIVSVKKILYKRGYLGQCLNDGEIYIDDVIKILDEKYEYIPYKLADRIKWYLDKREQPILVSDLVINIGLSKSYCRAVPNIIKKRDDIDKNKILYIKNKRNT